MHCLIMLLFLSIHSYYCIDVDYYDDGTATEDNKDSLKETVYRRFAYKEGTVLPLKLNTEYDRSGTISNQSHGLFYTSMKVKTKKYLYNKTPVTENSPRPKLVENYKLLKETFPKYKSKSNILKDYVYLYFEDDDESKMLRQLNVSNQIEPPLNDTIGKVKEQTVPFYNLEPAAEKVISDYFSREIEDENIWYVPENYPCWELPLLYGELGQKKKTSEVFLILGGRLRNVVEDNHNEKTSYRPPAPVSHMPSNRWCSVQPCYGDHTLCLFPDNTLSKLCEKGYKVQVPSVLEQIALVNTINSMRNQVARGRSDRYTHLPPAANMREINYDYDLEKISEAWLQQCLPGPAPCSALDDNTVVHLECTKYADECCVRSQSGLKCTPKTECFISPMIGCIHVWFWSGGKNIQKVDVDCGRTSTKTYNTVQLLWAKTLKMGCAYGERSNGDIRVVCNFSPGAPFYLKTQLYCGIIAHSNRDVNGSDFNRESFLSSLGAVWTYKELNDRDYVENKENSSIVNYYNIGAENVKTIWGVQSLSKIYKDGWVREFLGVRKNGTKGFIARLVTKYVFIDETEARCDTNESMYVIGEPGSMCIEKGQRYGNLCHDYRDPTTGFRTVAIAAPIALFSLILYDLFSGVVRQSY